MRMARPISTGGPEEIFIDREQYRERISALKGQLSGFEASVLRLYLGGLSYCEIAAEVNKSPKSVDNAVQRSGAIGTALSSGDFSES